MNEITEELITRAAIAYNVGASVEDIHDLLKEAGLSEYNAFLVYCAGKLVAEQPTVAR